MTGVDERYLQDILAEYYRIENCSLEFLREGGTHTYIVNGETKYLLLRLSPHPYQDKRP